MLCAFIYLCLSLSDIITKYDCVWMLAVALLTWDILVTSSSTLQVSADWHQLNDITAKLVINSHCLWTVWPCSAASMHTTTSVHQPLVHNTMDKFLIISSPVMYKMFSYGVPFPQIQKMQDFFADAGIQNLTCNNIAWIKSFMGAMQWLQWITTTAIFYVCSCYVDFVYLYRII